eukprot:COSAG02_NODE_2103_length_9818_cov_7.915226_1_plen_70_part_00
MLSQPVDNDEDGGPGGGALLLTILLRSIYIYTYRRRGRGRKVVGGGWGERCPRRGEALLCAVHTWSRGT